MNVLKPAKKVTLQTLLNNDVSQREISRKVGIDRKTIRKYERELNLIPSTQSRDVDLLITEGVATGFDVQKAQNPPPRPPGFFESQSRIPFHARSACEVHRQWIEQQVRLGRNAVAIYQDRKMSRKMSHFLACF